MSLTNQQITQKVNIYLKTLNIPFAKAKSINGLFVIDNLPWPMNTAQILNEVCPGIYEYVTSSTCKRFVPPMPPDVPYAVFKVKKGKHGVY